MKTASTSRLDFLNPRVLIGFALYAAGLVLAVAHEQRGGGDNAAAEPSRSVPGRRLAGGQLPATLLLHANHTATLLPNGQVMVAGGLNDLAS